MSGTINKENVLVFKVPRTEHYINEFAPDWAIFVRNDNTERGIEQCGHLNIDDVDGKIEEIELETTVKIIDNNDFNKKILQNTKRFTWVFKDIKIVAVRNFYVFNSIKANNVCIFLAGLLKYYSFYMFQQDCLFFSFLPYIYFP